MEYDIAIHGDIVEREASSFIRISFPNYEKVWKIYVGNNGKNIKADIPNYSDETKRQSFSEYSYTILESAYILHTIVKSEIFWKPINKIEDYIEFNKSFISFFAHIGRINDNLSNASDVLGLKNSYSPVLQAKLKKFYQARHICIHGKVIPFSQDELGIVEMPRLAIDNESLFGWPVREKLWSEAVTIEKEYIEDTASEYFTALMVILNDTYAHFESVIYSELKSLDTKIIYSYKVSNNFGTDIYRREGLYGIIIPTSSSYSNG